MKIDNYNKRQKRVWKFYKQQGSSHSKRFSSVQLLSCFWLFATPWTTACQVSLSITNSQSLPKLMSIESVMLSNHLILFCPLLLPPSIFPSIRVFSNESVLRIRWPKYWGFSFSISPSNEHPGLISIKMDWLDLLSIYLMNEYFRVFFASGFITNLFFLNPQTALRLGFSLFLVWVQEQLCNY